MFLFCTLQQLKIPSFFFSPSQLNNTLRNIPEIMAFVRARWTSRHHLLNRTAAHCMMLTAMDQYMSPCCKQTAIQVYRLMPVAVHGQTVRHGEA